MKPVNNLFCRARKPWGLLIAFFFICSAVVFSQESGSLLATEIYRLDNGLTVYLNEDHTLRHFRDNWYSTLFDRSIYPNWVERGSKRFDERLRERTAKVMKHQPAPLPNEVVKELEKMAQHWQ